ncbi:MAG: hypothetical protein Q9220_001606 [cf. Caloplaca sp. 1 TL-2023]
MTSATSKRTQARNEKALQELVKTVPGNDRCADCAARNPGWASWNVSARYSKDDVRNLLFLSAGRLPLHAMRLLTSQARHAHIQGKVLEHGQLDERPSRGKATLLRMTSVSDWSFKSMRRNGNVASNRIYNPRNSKPAIPLDVDEVDAALERFIRQKYDQQGYTGAGTVRPAARQDTGSTRSSDDQPPPLPPKPGKRFGFGLRSVSSALPTTKQSHISPPTSPDTANGYPPSPPIRVNKQSRVFGASVGGGGENMESKLATLKDMGFMDDKRNSTILKGLSGNLERAIETLVRLGDGNGPASRPRSPAKPRQIAVSQPIGLSQPFASVGVEPPQLTTNGAKKGLASSQEAEAAPVPLPSPPLQTNVYKTDAPEARPYNPFEVPNSRSETWPLDKVFENMQISQSQPQPLFPNATGGYPIQPQHIDASRHQQSMTPPVPQLHHHLHSNPYTQQSPIANNNNYNPFFQPSQQTPPIPSNVYGPGMQTPLASSTYNPFAPVQPPSQPYGNNESLQPFPTPLSQQTPQQQNMYTVHQNQQLLPQNQHQPDIFVPQQAFAVQPLYQYQQFSDSAPYQPQPLQVQPTGRIDKSSILALYNYPQLAPLPPPSGNVISENQMPVGEVSTLAESQTSPRAPTQRSVTMPAQLVSGSRNPFLPSNSNGPSAPSNTVPQIPSGLSRHISQESVDVGGYQTGRHSPDAFASLSARFVR